MAAILETARHTGSLFLLPAKDRPGRSMHRSRIAVFLWSCVSQCLRNLPLPLPCMCAKDGALARLVTCYPFAVAEDRLTSLQNTITSMLTSLLPAQHRWCVTGTPIRTGMKDLAGLLSFLKVEL